MNKGEEQLLYFTRRPIDPPKSQVPWTSTKRCYPRSSTQFRSATHSEPLGTEYVEQYPSKFVYPEPPPTISQGSGEIQYRSSIRPFPERWDHDTPYSSQSKVNGRRSWTSTKSSHIPLSPSVTAAPIDSRSTPKPEVGNSRIRTYGGMITANSSEGNNFKGKRCSPNVDKWSSGLTLAGPCHPTEYTTRLSATYA
eukprot:NODE_7619_length_758_cov_50.988976_g7006_i0.p1 GENE.NODE_7619_length_758_cov_50.988976_g7006_i0~~NODE_7619_length_758_cov_50.988976_g7006_i0.p1  ORF type:complete len:213 (+),score=24.76 NODE_7619_length_758_cov_50.988976_g7006_i0:55-639(+)